MALVQLPARMFELPPPYDVPLRLFGSDEQVAEAAAMLRQRGWGVHQTIAVSGSGSGSGLGAELCTSDVERGDASRPVWRPTPFLQEVFMLESVQAWLSSTPEGLAIDVGCGAGRDLVLMAQSLGDGWRVLGLDNDKGSLHSPFSPRPSSSTLPPMTEQTQHSTLDHGL